MAKSIKNCIKTLKASGQLTEATAADVLRRSDEYKAEGYTAEKADAMAVTDALDEQKADLVSVYQQIGIDPATDKLLDGFEIGKADVNLGDMFDNIMAEETKPKKAKKVGAGETAKPFDVDADGGHSWSVIKAHSEWVKLAKNQWHYRFEGMGQGVVIDTHAEEGRSGANRWRTSDGELHVGLAEAKAHEIETHVKPKLVDNGYLNDAAPAATVVKTKPVGEALKSAAINTGKGLGNAIDGLGKLFGGTPGTLGSGPVFNDETYALAKPLFSQAIANFKDAGTDLKEAMRAIIKMVLDKFGKQAAENMKPYVVRFMEDVRDGKIDYTEGVEQEKDNESDQRSSTNLERDSQDAKVADGMGEEGVRAGRDGDGGSGRSGIQGTQEDSGAGSSGSLFGPETVVAGERSDLEIYAGASRSESVSPGGGVDSGSDSVGVNGSPIEPESTDFVGELAESGLSLEQAKREQDKADKKDHRPGLQNVRDTLPILTEGQQEDVFKAETRFAVSDGYGMLFTNGTGTGKTFTGLGVIKRHVTAGKENIIVVVPNDKIAEDWQKSGTLLGLDITRLKDTNDAGRGVVITTYANFGQNPALASRNWDLIVHDEGHYLAMDKDGTSTLALSALKAISLHPEGAFARAQMLYADQYAEMNRLAADAKMDRTSDDERNWSRATATQAKADTIAKDLREKEKAVKEFIAANQGEKRPRALFLSATPFAYEKTVDWANGYLFDYNEGRASEEGGFRGYNTGSNREQFFMQHFGYRMRYGKLTAPDAKVDSGLMQRQFNTWLKKKGSLSGRMLDVKADYDRRFILTESAIGARIDEALQWFEQQRNATEDANRKSALFDVAQILAKEFDYLSRRYLLEAIKAREVIPHVKEHLALGRKVVVFHDYKKGGGFNPFDLNTISETDEAAASGDANAMNSIIGEFRDTFKDLIESDVFRSSSPITAFQKAFPGVLLFNGDVSSKDRRANVAKFQDDASGPQVMLVQSAAGKEGISLHDTTGKHQRVLFNLGQPTQPTTAIQQEGRIYRTGQVTDAIFRYLNTGTNWEKWAFATTIANRASAAENLGMGEQARALKDAFISGFEESDDYRAGMEGEGKGGKERDRAANAALTEYDRARAFYFGTQKKTSKTKAQEGADYFATPEPIGLKMVEFADIRPGEAVLEPSAGHGAIARWIPDSAEKTAIEPSMTLRPRLAMVFDGKIVDTTFEDHHVSNKYDAIVLNPPFGSGGTTAIQHLAKAATHLRDGGRIVALIPRGPAADKKFDKWFYEGIERPAKPVTSYDYGIGKEEIYAGDLAKIELTSGEVITGAVTDFRDGKLYVKEEGDPFARGYAPQGIRGLARSGKRTETYKPAEGLHLVADIVMPNVTFERAGTQVATRIVVIEKSKDAPQQYSPSFTDVDDINTLFDRMEGLALPARSKPVEEVKETDTPKTAKAKTEVARAAAIANEEKAKEAGAIVEDPDQATFALNAAGNKIITNAPTTEYTTNAGKLLTGVLVPNKAMAKAVDMRTWAMRGGGGKFFVRIEHIERPALPAFRSADSVPMENWLSVRDLSDVATEAFKKLGHSPALNILDTPADAGLAAQDQTFAGFVRNQVIYLVRDGIASREEAVATIWHELFHYGLRRFLSRDQYMTEMKRLYDRDAFIRLRANQWIKTDPEAQKLRDSGETDAYITARGADEALAWFAQSIQGGKPFEQNSMKSKLVRKIVKWMADIAEFFGAVQVASKIRAMNNEEARSYVSSVFGKFSDDSVQVVSWDGDKATFMAAQSKLTIQSSTPPIPPISNKAQIAAPLQGGQNPVANWDIDPDTKVKKFVYMFQNKHVDLKDVISAIGTPVRDAYNPYQREELYHKRVGKRTDDFLETELKPLLVQMRMNKVGREEFEEYLHARHAKEANALIRDRDGMQDGGSGMTDQEADDYFANLDPAKQATYEKLAVKVDAINAQTRQLIADYALESNQTVKDWGDMFKYYVPLSREDMEHGTGIGQGFSVKGPASKHRTGSSRKVVDILANIANQRDRIIVRGEKNRVAASLYALAFTNPNKEIWEAGKFPTKQVLVDGKITTQLDRGDPHFIVARIKDKNGNVHDRAVVFNKHNDRAVRLAKAMKNLDTPEMGVVLNNMGKVTRYIASINTQYNPVFVFVNLARDVQGATLNLSSTPLAGMQLEVLKKTGSALIGIMSDLRDHRAGKAPSSKWAKLYEEMQMEGGTTGFRDMFGSAIERSAEQIDELIKDKWGRDTQIGRLATGRSIFNLLADANETAENATRLAVYATALEHGMSKEKAASLAKNITVNFNRKGQVGSQMNAAYAFFNAAVQGTARLTETMTGPAGKKILTGGILLGVAQAMAMAAMGFDDDDPPKFVRERSLIIPLDHPAGAAIVGALIGAPLGPVGMAIGAAAASAFVTYGETKNGQRYAMIPMPLGFHIIPNFGRISTELFLRGGKDPGQAVLDFMSVMAEGLNPIGSAGLSLQTLLPSISDPAIALLENRDWTGKPIYRESFDKNEPGHNRAKDTATPAAKYIAKKANQFSGGTDYVAGKFSPTPDQLDYLWGQATGGVGREAAKAWQTINSIGSGEEMPVHKIPLVGRFYGEAKGQSHEAQKFYENLNRIDRLEKEVKGRAKAGEDVKEFVAENKDVGFIKAANKTQFALSQLRQQKRKAIEAEDKVKVKEVESKITALMLRFNSNVEKVTATNQQSAR